MSENAGGDNAAQAEVPPLTLPEEVTKATVRKTVWDYISKNRLANFPPVYQRIPNVKGIDEASKRLAETEFFKKATTLKSNPDKPQQTAVYHALDDKKTVLVPTPRLRTTLFTKLMPPEDADEAALRHCTTSLGIKEHSERLELDQSVKIDLHLLGSVAVTKQGHRVGKGDGFFDLEYAMMRTVGALDDNTPVVTTVQDFQVLDLPDTMFTDHDVKVDYIVTPTQVIKCGKQSQPKTIEWSMLTEDRLNRIPVLKKLRVFDFKAGKNVNLKEEEEAPTLEKLEEEAAAVQEDDGTEQPNYYRRKKRYRKTSFNRRRPRPNSEGGDASQEEGGDSKTDRPRRRNYGGRKRYSGRRRRTDSQKENEEGASEGEKASGEEGEDRRRPTKPRRRYQPRRRGNSQNEGNSGNESAGDGESPGAPRNNRRPRQGPRRFQSREHCLWVGKINGDVRVSEFKKEVRAYDVNPIQVAWYGNSGHAFLYFTSKEEKEEALDRLQDLKIEKRKLAVELSPRPKGKGKGDDGGEGDAECTEGGSGNE